MTVLEKLNSIKNQEITAKENVENYIKVIEEKNDDINSFLEINKEEALAKAEDIDARIKAGEEVGALAGLVFGIKANINVEDFIISAASKTLEDYIGSYDATVVKRIKAEDGIIIGINNMDEFAAGSSCETSYYGPVNNPAAPGRIPGGSSGGSAAAVAAEMCDIAIGSDTGGSIRNPSSHCGVLGFKPTYGAVSRQGLLDLSMSLDQIGPMANDITGITLALDTIVGYDRTECTTLKWEAPNFTEVALSIEGEKPLEGMKIATVKEFREVTDDTINEKIDEAIAKLEALGAEVVELEFGYIDICLPTYYLINYVEFFSATRKYDG
ncbi:MAG: amidase family protein, partial [Methanobrevibacter sp.]|nr:amidase family protein [Methanobrevibacter sp.]